MYNYNLSSHLLFEYNSFLKPSKPLYYLKQDINLTMFAQCTFMINSTNGKLLKKKKFRFTKLF